MQKLGSCSVFNVVGFERKFMKKTCQKIWQTKIVVSSAVKCVESSGFLDPKDGNRWGYGDRAKELADLPWCIQLGPQSVTK